MESLRKGNRQRALVVCRDPTVRKELGVLLSGYGFYIDEAGTRKEGMRNFFTYKHAAIFIESEFLPSKPRQLQKMFNHTHRQPLSFILAPMSDTDRIYPFLTKTVYGLVHLPLNMNDFTYTFERAIEYSRLTSNSRFFRDFFYIVGLSAPVLAVLVISILF